MATEPASETGWPQVFHVKDVKVLVWHHVIDGYVGEIPCWTYVSLGMEQVNQPELVITLRRRPNEAEENVSLEPLNWYKMVYAWGKKGRIIDPYHTHEAHSEHWLGSKRLETITYGWPVEIPGFGAGGLPPNRLHGMALTADEAQIAKAYGYMRVIGNTGLKYRWFPYQPWIDRDRDEGYSWQQTEGTLRQMTFKVTQKIRGVSLRREASTMVLEIPVGREEEIKAVVSRSPDTNALSLESYLHKNADSCYIWQKGQNQPMLYGGPPPYRCHGFCSVTFCPQQNKDHWNQVEDGATIFLCDATWAAVRDALINGRNISVSLLGENNYEPVELSIEFLRRSYRYDPTSLTLSTPNGVFKKWRARKADWLEKSAIRLDAIMTADGYGADPIADSAFVELMENIGEAVAACIPRKTKESQTRLVCITFNMPADTAEDCFTLRASPDMEGIDGTAIWDKLRALRRPEAYEPTTCTMYFGVWE